MFYKIFEKLLSLIMNSSPQKSCNLFAFRMFELIKVQTSENELRDIHRPSPRSGHRMVAANGNVYSFGGYNPVAVGEEIQHNLFKELWVYNCASKIWKLLETTGDPHEEVASHCAALIDNHLLVFGGTAFPFGEKSGNDANICNLRTLQWSKLQTEGDPPRKQYGQAMVVINENVYAIGGTTGFTYSNEVHCLSLATKKWERVIKEENKPSQPNIYEPEPRYRHEVAVYDNKIFMFGGGTSTDSFGMNELPVFDLVKKTWSLVPTQGTPPEARRCHVCSQCDSDVYICGGHNNSRNFNCIYRINLKNLVWEKLDISLPYSLYFHAAAMSESYQLFIFGGVDGEENERTNDMFSFFVKIPPLAKIAWQAILHYVPHIALLEKKVLFEVGVPLCFLNEIDFISSCDTTSPQDLAEDDGDEEWEDM